MFLYEAPKPPKKVKVTKPRPAPRKSQDVLEHLKKGWLPISEAVLQQASDLVENNKRLPDLLNLVKQETPLYFHVARYIKLHSGEVPDDGIDPLKALETLEHARLHSLFSPASASSGTHRAELDSQMTTSCTQVLQISAHAAQTLAEGVSLQGNEAFQAALFRSLGHYLIAWNYPKLYARTLATHKKAEADIDAQLLKLLGISPTQIGAKFAHEWGLHRSVIRNVDFDQQRSASTPTTEPFTKDNVSIPQICDLAETFARSKDPHIFPNAPEKWAEQEDLVRNVWGSEIFSDLEAHARSVKDRLSEREAPSEQGENDGTVIRDALSQNRYLRQCPEHIIERFTQVYSLLDDAALSLDAIRVMSDFLIPQLGFPRGCLFLKDEKSLELRPMLRVGKAPLTEYAHLLLDSRKGIVNALYTTAPVRLDAPGVEGRQSTILFGNLRHPRFAGVLYLELHEKLEQNTSFDPLVVFHTIREALNHCLGE